MLKAINIKWDTDGDEEVSQNLQISMKKKMDWSD